MWANDIGSAELGSRFAVNFAGVPSVTVVTVVLPFATPSTYRRKVTLVPTCSAVRAKWCQTSSQSVSTTLPLNAATKPFSQSAIDTCGVDPAPLGGAMSMNRSSASVVSMNALNLLIHGLVFCNHSTCQDADDTPVIWPISVPSVRSGTASDPASVSSNPKLIVPTTDIGAADPSADPASFAEVPSSSGQYTTGSVVRIVRRIADMDCAPWAKRRITPAHTIGTVESFPDLSHRVGHSLTKPSNRMWSPSPGSTDRRIGVLRDNSP